MGLKWKVVEACRIFEEAKEMYIVSCRRGNQSSGRTGDLEEQCFGDNSQECNRKKFTL